VCVVSEFLNKGGVNNNSKGTSMAKVELAKAFEAIRGKIGDLLFKNQDGKQTVMRLPDYSGRQLPPQLESQKPVMQRAGRAWANLKAENPLVFTAYAARARQLKRSVFSLFYNDYCVPPSVQEIDASEYTGRAGQKISVCVHDVFDVRQVEVTIRAAVGTVLESGAAAKLKATGNWWVYVAQLDGELAPGTTVEAVALDWPGNRNSRVQALNRPG
jgi:hypothetical protein